MSYYEAEVVADVIKEYCETAEKDDWYDFSDIVGLVSIFSKYYEGCGKRSFMQLESIIEAHISDWRE